MVRKLCGDQARSLDANINMNTWPGLDAAVNELATLLSKYPQDVQLLHYGGDDDSFFLGLVDMASRYPTASSEGPPIEPLHATVTALYATLFAQVTTRRSTRSKQLAAPEQKQERVKSPSTRPARSNKEEKAAKPLAPPVSNLTRPERGRKAAEPPTQGRTNRQMRQSSRGNAAIQTKRPAQDHLRT